MLVVLVVVVLSVVDVVVIVLLVLVVVTGVIPTIAVTNASTTGSTFEASPVVAQPPAVSAFPNAAVNLSWALVTHAGSTAICFSVAFA